MCTGLSHVVCYTISSMAVYKVPQDVEADDKLIGPFSFRQFVYIIIAIVAIALGWGLSRLFIPLAIIPLPIVVFFGALALPLRKDQPMEIYLAAVVSFYLKPRKRLWQPDGIQSLVEITAPHVKEIHRAKDLSEAEAEQRLSYLADIVDTGGWAVRGVTVPETNTAMQSDAFFEAQQTEDILDDSAGVSRSFDTMISETDARRRQEIIERLHQPAPVVTTTPQFADPYSNLASAATPTPNPFTDSSLPAATPQPFPPADDPHVDFNPYPTDIHQMVINPLGSQPAQPASPPASQPQAIIPPADPTPTTSEKTVSPDIINLANNSDLSIETIAHEAQRIHEREEKLPEDEVVISLR